MTRRVVITGLGCVTPVGNDVPSTWDSLVSGRTGIGRITRFDPAPYETQIAGEVKGFDPLKYMDRKDVRRTDRFTQLGVAGASQAIADSGIDPKTDGDRFGVAIATGVGGLETLIEQVLVMEKRGPSRLSPFLVPALMANAASAQVSMQFGVRGPNLTHVSACASSAHALGESAEMIKRGMAEVMVAGGAEAAVIPLAIGAFAILAFPVFFELFHRLFFSAGTYLFDPTTERLVQLFPTQFWSDTTIAIGGVVLGLSIVVALLAGRRARRAAADGEVSDRGWTVVGSARPAGGDARTDR